jgi:uncharacterized protein YbaP (TraB family)
MNTIRARSFSFFLILPLLLGARTTAVAQTTDKALLWEITGKDLKKPSYLYGTIHIQAGPVFQYDKIVEEKIRQADAFALELLLDELDQAAVMRALLMEGNTLDKLMTPGEYAKVDEYFKAKTSLPLSAFNNMKPFMVYTQLMQTSMPKDKEFPLDMQLLTIARENKKKAYAIETLEEQMGAFNSISLEDQAKMLVKMVNDTADSEKQYDELVATYLDQDLDKMITFSEDPSLPEDFSKNFLIDRNRKMVKTIMELMSKASTFSAVGAAHLGGPDGLLALLQKAGYTVKPVKFKFRS